MLDNRRTFVRGGHDALSPIVKSAQESAEKARAIQLATSEEAAIGEKIQTAVGSLSEQAENISFTLQEQNRGSSFIVNAAQKVRELSQQVETATNEQSDGSQPERRRLAQAALNEDQSVLRLHPRRSPLRRTTRHRRIR